jgi:hypothetical protein
MHKTLPVIIYPTPYNFHFFIVCQEIFSYVPHLVTFTTYIVWRFLAQCGDYLFQKNSYDLRIFSYVPYLVTFTTYIVWRFLTQCGDYLFQKNSYDLSTKPFFLHKPTIRLFSTFSLVWRNQNETFSLQNLFLHASSTSIFHPSSYKLHTLHNSHTSPFVFIHRNSSHTWLFLHSPHSLYILIRFHNCMKGILLCLF